MKAFRRKSFIVLLIILGLLAVSAIRKPALLVGKGLAAAPTSLDCLVTISSPYDHKYEFVTCAQPHPSVIRRLLRSDLLGAFVIQSFGEKGVAFEKSGLAHLEFQGTFLSIVFADGVQAIFSTAATPLVSSPEELILGHAAVGSYSSTGFKDHQAFVASRDWWKNPATCDL